MDVVKSLCMTYCIKKRDQCHLKTGTHDAIMDVFFECDN